MPASILCCLMIARIAPRSWCNGVGTPEHLANWMGGRTAQYHGRERCSLTDEEAQEVTTVARGVCLARKCCVQLVEDPGRGSCCMPRFLCCAFRGEKGTFHDTAHTSHGAIRAPRGVTCSSRVAACLSRGATCLPRGASGTLHGRSIPAVVLLHEPESRIR